MPLCLEQQRHVVESDASGEPVTSASVTIVPDLGNRNVLVTKSDGAGRILQLTRVTPPQRSQQGTIPSCWLPVCAIDPKKCGELRVGPEGRLPPRGLCP